jgi:hypothetical protein
VSERADGEATPRRSAIVRISVSAVATIALATAAIFGLARLHQLAHTPPGQSSSGGLAAAQVTARPYAVAPAVSAAPLPTATVGPTVAGQTTVPGPSRVPEPTASTALPTSAQIRNCGPGDFSLTASPPAQPGLGVGRWLMVKTSSGKCLLQHWEVFLHLTDDQGVSQPGFPLDDGGGVIDANSPPYLISKGYSIPSPVRAEPPSPLPPGTYNLWATCNLFGTSAPVSVTLP